MARRDEPKHRMTVDRELMLFHYEHAFRHSLPRAAVRVIIKRDFGSANLKLVLLSSAAGKHQALYCLRQGPETGYRFRRLHPELDGSALTEAVKMADAADPKGLVALGLSYAEVELVTGLDRAALGKVLRRT